MYTPPSIRPAVATIRAYLDANDVPALVISRYPDVSPQPVAPARLCEHCRLPIGTGGPHGACDEARRAA